MMFKFALVIGLAIVVTADIARLSRSQVVLVRFEQLLSDRLGVGILKSSDFVV